MKNLSHFLSLFAFIFFMTSCGNDEPTVIEIEETIEQPIVDDANAEETAADTSSTGVYQEEVTDEETSLQDAMKNSNTEPTVEEGGMSFCDCVKKQKEYSDKMMADETSDAEFDKAMADLEALKTGDCKFMFDIKQNTVDAKKAYQRKVKRCL